MSVETQVSIVRPDIFPECKNCHIVSGLIENWITYKPSIKHVSARTNKLLITCTQRQQQVFLHDEVEMQIQFTENGQVLDVLGGNVKPEPVSCPHLSLLPE